ncbi:MAG: hypothetical protein R3Y64_10445 [Peptostreptococcaceae bacterium]
MNSLISRWTTDSLLELELRERAKEFFNQFNVEYHDLIKKIINTVYFYDNSLYTIEIKKYIKKLSEDFNEGEICFIGMNKTLENSPKNSDVFLQHFKGKFTIFNSISNIDFTKYNKIVLLDDYIGSGKQTLSCLIELNKIVNNKEIIISPFSCTNFAVNRISKEISSMNNKIQFNLYKTRKAFIFSNFGFTNVEKDLFKKICKDILDIPGDYIFGYNKVEEALGFHYFTPNNSIGILWYESSRFSPLFIRNGSILGEERLFLTKEMILKIKKIEEYFNNPYKEVKYNKTILVMVLFEVEINTIIKYCRSKNIDFNYLLKYFINLDVISINNLKKYNKKYYAGKNFKAYFYKEYVIVYNEIKAKINNKQKSIIKSNLMSTIKKS